MDRDEDTLTAEEVKQIARVADLHSFRQATGLRPLPYGKGLYSRKHLDTVMQQARDRVAPTPMAAAEPVETPDAARFPQPPQRSNPQGLVHPRRRIRDRAGS